MKSLNEKVLCKITFESLEGLKQQTITLEEW